MSKKISLNTSLINMAHVYAQSYLKDSDYEMAYCDIQEIGPDRYIITIEVEDD